MAAVDDALKNKVALVTGGSKGIGRAIALAFSRAGARVAVAARGTDALEAVKREIDQVGPECLAVPTDLSSDDQAERLHDAIVNEFGSIDILINNAGMAHIVELSKITREQFNEVLELNTWAALHLSQLCYPGMKEKGGGVILNIASNGGVKPDIFAGAYSASKAAMIILTKQMACEWGNDGIRCAAICPGLVRTELAADLVAFREAHGFQNLVNRAGEPEEIAAMALLLAGPAGGYCQGGVYLIDGGSTVNAAVNV